MSGIALDEISSNLQEFQGSKRLSKKFFGVLVRQFRDFQFWRREPPYLCAPGRPEGTLQISATLVLPLTPRNATVDPQAALECQKPK